MTRLSPAVSRTVAVLDFFADHPMRSFTMTDVVRSLKLSRATCHALLAALVDSGYLFRDSNKNYVLGPRLAAIGRVAHESFSPLAVARSEMRTLADEFDVVCAAVALEGSEMVTRERAASISHLRWAVAEGSRLPFRAPYGAAFAAWMPEPEIDAWLANAVHPLTPQMIDEDKASLAFFRRLGFCFGLRKEKIRDEAHAKSMQLDENLTFYFPTELKLDEEYELGSIAAPIFGADRRVDFNLALVGFTHAVSGRDIAQMGAQIKAACDRISTYVSRQPATAMVA
jgi:DNA-binding IclR family transcriptional regulator